MRFLVKLSSAILPLFAIGVFAFSARAQESSGIIAEVGKGLGTPVAVGVYVILLVVQQVSIYILTVSAALLDTFFKVNVLAVPSGIPIVPIAWAALRDLTNGIFLLVILWIAATIIFGVEQWGGKRLLGRVILVALFINFSLLMVTIIFGFTNQLGAIFADNMPKEPATFMVNAIRIQEIGNVATQQRAAAAEQSATEQARQAQQHQTIRNQTSVKETLLASLGVPTAHAQGTAVAGCAGGVLIGLALTPITGGLSLLGGAGACVGGSIFAGVLKWITGWGASALFDKLMTSSLRMSVQTLFILFTAVTMFLGGITLLIRYGVMIALAVLAPLAFIAAAIPKMEKHFHTWLSALLRWAFFVPLFYLLMYLGLYIIKNVSAAAPRGTGPAGSFDQILIPFVGLLFMWMALRLARKTGGAVAEWGVNKFAQLGLLAAGGIGGLAMRGAGAAMARAPERTERFTQALRRIPGVGRPMERGMRGIIRDRKSRVETRIKELDEYSSESVGDMYRRSTSAEERAAAAAVLGKRKDFNRILANEEERKRAVKYAERFGLAKDLFKTNPHLITAENAEKQFEAKMKVMREADKFALAQEAYDDDETILALMANIRGRKELRRIHQEMPGLYYRIEEIRRTKAEDVARMFAGMDQKSGARQEGTRLREVLEGYETNLANEMRRGRRRRGGERAARNEDND